MMRFLDPDTVKELTESDQEYALLDVREEGAFSENRLLFASCLAMSRLELRAPRLVPNKNAFIVLMDGAGEGLAEQAHAKLTDLGYQNISILKGGVQAWSDAGHSTYSGVNVLSKAFGEIVYEHSGTPDITPEILKAWMDEGRKMVVLDSRPFDEYHHHTIPTSVSVPGAELAFRSHELAPDADTAIVVNCAGRTRSIIGCQSLINAGLPNDVYCLKNGTMGWKLAGYDLETGQTRRISELSPETRLRAKECTRRVADRFGVRFIQKGELAELRQKEDRTVYCLDVRGPEEFAQGHLPDTDNAPGGQLVQATDDYIAVRNAAIVLIDPETIRAVMTASWLLQLGLENVFVLEDVRPQDLTAKSSTELNHLVDENAVVSAEVLADKMKGDRAVLLLDVAVSVAHKTEHIPGAAWAVRGRYDAIKSDMKRHDEVVVTGDDPALVAYVLDDLSGDSSVPVYALKGGNDAWRNAGYPMASGFAKRYSECDDVWYKPFEYDDPDQERAAANKYLTWEVNLVEKIKQDGITFKVPAS